MNLNPTWRLPWECEVHFYHINTRRSKNPAGQSNLICSEASALSIPMVICRAFPPLQNLEWDLFSIGISDAEVATELNRGEDKVGVAQTLYYLTQITTVFKWEWGVSAGQEKSNPKISFHSLRSGCGGAAAEKRVISTTAGEQKATWYRRKEKRRRNGDVGPERTSEWSTLRGWGCLSVLLCRSCAADTDYPITRHRGRLKRGSGDQGPALWLDSWTSVW